MVSNKNIFYVSNPAKILDGLWQMMSQSGVDLTNMVIFVPSRRAVRSVEKMIVENVGHAALLPQIVPLGEGFESEEDLEQENAPCVVSNMERIVTMSYLLSKIDRIGSISAALPVAHTLVTMQDYLENVGKKISDIDLDKIMGSDYAKHFQEKAQILDIVSRCESNLFGEKETETRHRNKSIDGWADYVRNMNPEKSLVIVCGSTASVLVTRKLMKIIAGLSYGRIILSGKIYGKPEDFVLETNPYHSEYEFLTELGFGVDDVCEINLGKSNIDFMNDAFINVQSGKKTAKLENCHLVECHDEAQEASSVAEIVHRSVKENKSVLVITPDVAANTRLKAEFDRLGIMADFSSGISGAMTLAGRAILNLFDEWIEKQDSKFDEIYTSCNYDLFDTIAEIVDKYLYKFEPSFFPEDFSQIWLAVKNLSDYIIKIGLKLNIYDTRALLADYFSSVSVRPIKNEKASVVVLGTIESRMQTADVVILTGLNEGMFPSLGYSNPWLARKIAKEIGLPSPEHKVSLMALDFMNLSCNPCVYWVRSKISSGAETQESRFISRVIVLCGKLNKDMKIDYKDIDLTIGNDILKTVTGRDEVKNKPLDYSYAELPRDWSDVYVTWLERWINNPYLYYVEHILNLEKKKDYWEGVEANDFGNLVHEVLRDATTQDTKESLINKMDELAIERYDINKNGLMFSFWHKRFEEIAPFALKMLCETPDAKTEIKGFVEFKVGDTKRIVRAKADRVWDGGVLDIKTGKAPEKARLEDGTVPQLPLEALMLRENGFEQIETTEKSQNPTIEFLQLKAKEVKSNKISAEKTAEYIIAAKTKVQELFNVYSAGNATYEYRKDINPRYKMYQDFARTQERDD